MAANTITDDVALGRRPSIAGQIARDPAARAQYLTAALPHIPRLIGAMDRNPFRRTYGCLDRQYWHYRTSDFPSEMYQEGVLPLALVYRHEMPGNRWHGREQLREWAVAGMRFAARSCHEDGSCDDYYPYERALGAAVFSLVAAANAYRTLDLQDDEILAWLRLRAAWVAQHEESGRLTNHHALAALGLLQVAEITKEQTFADAAQQRLRRVLAWQSDEGWFDEYGGADPGYQTVTIDCLAQCRAMLKESASDAQNSLLTTNVGRANVVETATSSTADWLDEPLRRATAFARWFLHPDDSYAGEYGSRGTHHFYPHGMELLAAENADAADLADGFLRALDVGKQANFDDDRLFAHRLGNLLLAYQNWSPQRAMSATNGVLTQAKELGESDPQVLLRAGLRLALQSPVIAQDDPQADTSRHFAQARLFIRRTAASHTVISAARGGVFKNFSVGREPTTDAGLIVEFDDGSVAVSQMHDGAREFDWPITASLSDEVRMTNDEVKVDAGAVAVHAPLHFARHEVATPLKFAVFRWGLLTVGRCCRTLVRRLLQRRLITGRREAPIVLTRRFDFVPSGLGVFQGLRVTDLIELTDDFVRVRRMSFGVDHHSTYTAAAGAYQDGALAPWVDLSSYVAELNAQRKVTIVREYP